MPSRNTFRTGRCHRGLVRRGVVAALLLAAMNASAAAQDSAKADLAAAKKEFQSLCAPCHGVAGRGNGPVAASLTTPPADLTRISQRNGGRFPKALVFVTVVGVERPAAHGTREMPVWGDIFVEEAVGGGVAIEDAKRATAEVERRIDGLIAYIESIQELE